MVKPKKKINQSPTKIQVEIKTLEGRKEKPEGTTKPPGEKTLKQTKNPEEQKETWSW
ncbi:hypothetical protein HYE03_03890 [Mycoplasmopsis bovis]|nr:hypothetical protein [Mycoplasmopsis bovis]QQH27936.1 hypothetical protein HYE03_03890 [Mycoplasmopsis bovis]